MSEETPHADLPRRSHFGEWLTEQRIRLGLKQQDLAVQLGVHSGRVSEWETGRRVPSPELLQQLQELLGGPGVPPPPAPRRILEPPPGSPPSPAPPRSAGPGGRAPASTRRG